MKHGLFLLLLLLLGCQRPIAEPVREPLPSPPNYYVILDAGHGGFDAGAMGAETGVKEAVLNLQVALKVKEALEAEGVWVLMTRTEAEALGSTKGEDMARRGELLKSEGADVAVSLHMNSFADRTVKGPMVYYQAGAREGEALAAALIDSLTQTLALPHRLPNPGNNFVTRLPNCPAALVECGFLSNPQEELLLSQEAYQQTLAEAVARGILAYLSGLEALEPVP